jgi:galactokinase
MVKHSIAKGEYNQRRTECETGAAYFAQKFPKVKALRDVTQEDFSRLQDGLPDTIKRRCRHVIGENSRVLEAARSLESGDLTTFGSLMRESHRSLRDDFEVSCSELNLMVELAENVDGMYGARMTGGGFGGCTINLVGEHSVEAFQNVVGEEYERAMGIKPEIYVCSAAEGASRLL